MTTVKLIYPAFKCGHPHVAEAIVDVRLTPKQIIVDRGTAADVTYVNGHTSRPIIAGSFRFWRGNGAPVGGHPMLRAWQLADGEHERLNAEANEQQAKARKGD